MLFETDTHQQAAKNFFVKAAADLLKLPLIDISGLMKGHIEKRTKVLIVQLRPYPLKILR